MQVVGIIFFASLAFAIAILILITCCFFKVNSSTECIRDPEKCKADTIHRMHQIAHNKSECEEKPIQNANVMLFLHKKNKYSDVKKNHYQSHSSDGLGIGHFNDGFSSHHGGWGHHSNDHGFDTHDCGDDGGHGGDCDGGGND